MHNYDSKRRRRNKGFHKLLSTPTVKAFSAKQRSSTCGLTGFVSGIRQGGRPWQYVFLLPAKAPPCRYGNHSALRAQGGRNRINRFLSCVHQGLPPWQYVFLLQCQHWEPRSKENSLSLSLQLESRCPDAEWWTNGMRWRFRLPKSTVWPRLLLPQSTTGVQVQPPRSNRP